jgi:hypothetical protein
MTWVVGISTPFAYSMTVSDIAVTVGGRAIDCLQKVYPITRFVSAAFAGSVQIGFDLVTDMVLSARSLEPTKAVWPRKVFQEWHRRARHVFDNAPAKARELRAELLIAGLDPKHDAKVRPWPRAHLIRLRSPEFAPEFVKTNVAASIGIGESVPAYKAALEEYASRQNQVYEFESHGPAIGNLMAQFAGRVVEQAPQPGISKHMHICTVRRWNVDLGDNSAILDEGQMPQVARSWDELMRMLVGLGFTAAEIESAVC